jgi:hypothetical protein
VADIVALRAVLPKLSGSQFHGSGQEAGRRRTLLALLEPLTRRKTSSGMTAHNANDAEDGEPAMHGRELRELAYKLLRKIEHQLGDLGDVSDASIAATVAQCQQTLADIKASLPTEY